MPVSKRSSRERFREYKQYLRRRRKGEDVELAADIPVRRRKSKDRNRSFMDLLRSFYGLVAGYRRTIGLCLVAATFATVLGLLPPYGMKIVFDNVLGEQGLAAGLPDWLPLPETKTGMLVAVAIAMISITLTSLLIGLWGRWHMTRLNKRLQIHTRDLTFDHAVRLPLHRVYEIKSGGAASILRDDAGGVGDLLFSMVYNPWKAIVQLCGTLAILSWTDWRLLIGAMIVLPIVWITHKTWISRIRPLWRDVRASRTRVDSHATEVFGGMRVVRTFNRERSEAASFVTNNAIMMRQELYTWWWMRGIDVAWQIMIPAATALLLCYGGMRVLADQQAIAAGTMDPDNAMTAGKLVMFITYLAWLLGPIATLANSATGFQNSLAGLDRVLDLLEEPTELPRDGTLAELDPAKVEGRIELQDVSFKYPRTDTIVLEGISIDVKPGQTIALVGHSGAGKTTLCNLIARFYDPSSGAILLDGQDLRELNPDSYRKLLSIVEQDVFLFDGSIAENIGYGRRHANREQVIEAAELANAHEFIREMPEGYDTYIGERGVKLSGGQRQRLAIARAILADPRILILDEATSNLDTESERLIQTSLETLMRGRTSFVIAHRLSTIRHADVIMVLEHGELIESGRHHELMERSGRYRTMVDLQTHEPEREGAEVEA